MLLKLFFACFHTKKSDGTFGKNQLSSVFYKKIIIVEKNVNIATTKGFFIGGRQLSPPGPRWGKTLRMFRIVIMFGSIRYAHEIRNAKMPTLQAVAFS